MLVAIIELINSFLVKFRKYGEIINVKLLSV